MSIIALMGQAEPNKILINGLSYTLISHTKLPRGDMLVSQQTLHDHSAIFVSLLDCFYSHVTNYFKFDDNII